MMPVLLSYNWRSRAREGHIAFGVLRRFLFVLFSHILRHGTEHGGWRLNVQTKSVPKHAPVSHCMLLVNHQHRHVG